MQPLAQLVANMLSSLAEFAKVSRTIFSTLQQLPLLYRWRIGARCMATLAGHRGAVNYLTKLDGGLVASGADDGVKVWNLATGECVWTFASIGLGGAVLALAELDGGLLASGTDDGRVKVTESARAHS